MTAAEKILVVGGVVNIAYGVLTGFPMSLIRMKGASSVSKYLTFAHVGPLMQGPLLLAMVFAERMSSLSAQVETIAAWLLVVGAVLLGLKDTLNWLTRVQDEFRERPLSAPIASLSVLATSLGTSIFLLGVLRAL